MHLDRDPATENYPVVICMAAYNPPEDLFARQIESIRAQTHPNWICIICDDGSPLPVYEKILRLIGNDTRFQIHRNDHNLGHYGNFEKCMSLVPPEATFVALADQDDNWHPDKIERLLAEFDEETTLVYSDMNLTDHAGRVLATSYWGTRLNQFERLDFLLIANTISGAACMFRRRLLDDILPMPVKQPGAFHDHWIGCVALAAGKIKYIDRPLYDYVQHGENVIGHAPGVPRSIGAKLMVGLGLFAPWGFRKRLRAFARVCENRANGPMSYVLQVVRTLESRFSGRLTQAKELQLRRVGGLPRSWRSIFWLLLLLCRRRSGVSETNGQEGVLFKAVLWCRYVHFKSWLLCRFRQRPPKSTGASKSL